MSGHVEPSWILGHRVTWRCVKLVGLYTSQNLMSTQITEEPFIVEKCVLLVLRLNHFLPENRPLIINTRRVLREPGGPSLSASESPSWTQYLPKDDRMYLTDSFGQEFTEFDFVSKRRREQTLSVFSRLVNANSKLQAADRRDDSPASVINYIIFIKAAAKAIFFVPCATQERAEGELPDIELEDFDPYPEEDNGEEYDEDDDEGVEPDTINGLTFPEMETVIQRASDGTISAEERTEAAMLMLGMAGGEFLSFSPSLRFPLLTPGAGPQASTNGFSINPRLHISGRDATDRATASSGMIVHGITSPTPTLCFVSPLRRPPNSYHAIQTTLPGE